MTSLAVDRDDYLSLVSRAADQLAKLGFLWQPTLGKSSAPTREAVVLAFTPVARRNGFQSLPYRAAWVRGFAPLPVLDPYPLPNIPIHVRNVSPCHMLRL